MADGKRGSFAKRSIAAIYSRAAKTLYEPIVVKTAFPLFGGDLNELVLAQGRRAVRAAKGRPILDMPVGTAYFTLSMARASDGLVVGVDIAEGMVKKAMETARSAGVTNLKSVQADAHHLPFESGSFGAILCTNGLQVIPGLRPSLAELVRVLASNGRLYISVVTLPISGALPETAAERLPTILKSRRDILRALTEEGLEVTSIDKNRFALLIEATKATI